MSMNYNKDKLQPRQPQPKKNNNNKKIAEVIIIAVLGTVGAIGITHYVMSMQDSMEGKTSILSNILSGEYDTMLREKCIERLNSYGLGTVPEGSINLCVDTAKAIAYHELNK